MSSSSASEKGGDARPGHVLAIQDSKHGLESHGSIKTGGTDDEGTSVAEQHIFSDPVVAERWRDIYKTANYENRHRFDPTFTWSAEEERRLVRKIDLRIMIWAWTMFCALDVHRRNINRAISDNMLPELGSCRHARIHSCPWANYVRVLET